MNTQIFPTLWRLGAILAMLFSFAIEAQATQYGIPQVEYVNQSTGENASQIGSSGVFYINPETTVTIDALGEVGTKIRVIKDGSILAESSDTLNLDDFFLINEDPYTGESFEVNLPEGENEIYTQILSNTGSVIKNYDSVNIFVDTTYPTITTSIDPNSSNPHGLAWISGIDKLYGTVNDAGGSGLDTNTANIQYELYDKTADADIKSPGDVISATTSEVRLRPQGGNGSGTFTDGHEYYLEFTISDKAGNTATSRHDFTIDYSAPSIVASNGGSEDILILGYYDPNHPNCNANTQCQPGGTLPGYMPYNYTDPENNNILYTNPTHFAIKLQDDHYSTWNAGPHVILARSNRLYYGNSYTQSDNHGDFWIGAKNAVLNYNLFPWINASERIFQTKDIERYEGTTRESWRWRDASYNTAWSHAYLTADASLTAPAQPAPPPPPQPPLPTPDVTITSPSAIPNQNEYSRIPAPHDGGEKWNILDENNRLIPDFSGTVSDPTRERIVRVEVNNDVGLIGAEITVPTGETTWSIPNSTAKNIRNDDTNYYFYDLYARTRYSDEPDNWSDGFYLRIWTDFYRPTFVSSNASSNPIFQLGGTQEILTVLAKDEPHGSSSHEDNYGRWKLDYNASTVAIFDSEDQVVTSAPTVTWTSNGDGTYTGSIDVASLPSGHYYAITHLVDNFQNEKLTDDRVDFVVDNSRPIAKPLKGDGTELKNYDEVSNISEIHFRVADITGVDASIGKTSMRLYKKVSGAWEQIPISGISVEDLGEDTYNVRSGAYIVEEAEFQIRAIIFDNAGNQSLETIRTFTVVPETFSFRENPLRILPDLEKNILSQTIIQGAIPLSGAYEVRAKWEGDKYLDSVIVLDEDGEEITLSSGNDFRTIYPSFDFGATAGVLNIQMKTPPERYGIGKLFVIVRFGSGMIGSTTIDTREFGGITNSSAGERYALDPLGQLLDFRPGDGRGVVVSGPDTNNNITVNGMLWSKVFGWIHLQPCTDGTPGVNCDVDPEIRKTLDSNTGCGSEVCVNIAANEDGQEEKRADLEGYGWNEQIGWILFGDQDGSGGVHIDEEGFFHGVAWSENFGPFVMGDRMAGYNTRISSLVSDFTPTPESHPSEKGSSWARTDWRFPNNTAPTVYLVGPTGNPWHQTTDRTPILTFHIEDAEENDVGYTIEINKERIDGSWARVLLIDQEATLRPNPAGEYMIYNSFAEDLRPGKYNWSVTAFDEFRAYSDPTPHWDFEIVNEAPTVSILDPSPADGASTDKYPEFGFRLLDPNGDNMKWQLQIARDASFSTASLLDQSSYFSGMLSDGDYDYSPIEALPAETLYWRVVAEDEYEMQGFSEIRTMVVQNNPPEISDVKLLDNSLIHIADGGTTIDTAPKISWKTNDSDSTDITTDLEVHLVSNNSLVWSSTVSHTTNYNQIKGISPDLTSCAATATDLSNCTYSYNLQSCDDDGTCSAVIDGGTFTVQEANRYGNIGTEGIAPTWPERMIAPDVISSNNRFAWNENTGWIDLNPIGGGVIVGNNSLQGFAWSETFGWIRMNSEAIDPEIGIVDSGANQITEDAIGSYAVSNDGTGVLSGKAHIESTGEFLYFDGTTFEDDGGTLGSDPINVSISITPDEEKGHFNGRGWSDSIGWVSFGWEEIMSDTGMPEADATDVFPISEWPHDTATANLNTTRYFVFSARNSDYEILLATLSLDGGGYLCDESNNPIETDLTLEKMNPDGTAELRVFTEGTDFSVNCHNDGAIWIHLHPTGSIDGITKTAGLYRISGSITDEDGTVTNLPKIDSIHDFSDDPVIGEFIVQVVAGAPDFDDFIAVAGYDAPGGAVIANPIADNDDYFQVQLELKDTFGNPIIKSHKYEEPLEPLLKDVLFRTDILDCVSKNQVEDIPLCDNNVVRYTTPSPNDQYFNDSLRYKYFTSETLSETENSFGIDIRSIAPTNSGSLSIKKVSATIAAQQPGFPDVGTGNSEQDVTHPLSFDPIISATIENYENFFASDDGSEKITIKLTNKSDSVNFLDFDWLGQFFSHLDSPASPIEGNSYFRDIMIHGEPEYAPSGSGIKTLEIAGSRENIASIGFEGGDPTLFPSIVGTTNTIKDRVFPTISANQTLEFQVSAIPEFNNSGGEEYPEFLHYFSFLIGGVNISFPIGNTPPSAFPLSERKISVSGQTHGENISEYVIVSENPGSNEFSVTGNVYTRQEIRNVMRENYDRITGPLRQKKEETPDYSNGEVVLEDWNDIQTERNNMNGVRSLQDKKALWYLHEEENAQDLTLVLGDGYPGNGGIEIPADQGPITLFVEGGNVFIRDNITIGEGSNLGIVVLSSRSTNKANEGNIFIDPSVTHLEGVYFADGSMMSAKDSVSDNRIAEGEILDGFNPEANEYSLADFSNQLYIHGSVASQNVIGESSSGAFPIMKYVPSDCNPEADFGDIDGCDNMLAPELLLSVECDGAEGDGSLKSDCNELTAGNQVEFTEREFIKKKAARRFDFLYMRTYKLQRELELDTNGDGIADSKTCAGPLFPLDPADTRPDGSGAFCSVCQDLTDGTPLPNLPADCGPTKIVAYNTPASGQCAEGTEWCQTSAFVTGSNGQYRYECSVNPDALCDENGALRNNKMNASVIFEYDPRVKEITPVGMDVSASFLIDKTIN